MYAQGWQHADVCLASWREASTCDFSVFDYVHGRWPASTPQPTAHMDPVADCHNSSRQSGPVSPMPPVHVLPTFLNM